MQNPYMTESNPYMAVKNPYMDDTENDTPSILNRVGKAVLQTPRGIAEAGASLVTGMYDYPVAALGRIVGRAGGMPEDIAQEFGESFTSKFQPETPIGQRAASAFGRVMEPIVGVTVEEPSRIVGQRFNSKQAEDIAKLGAMVIAPKITGKATGYTKSQARIAADTIRERTDLSSLTDVVKERGKGESISAAVEKNPYLSDVKAESNPYMEPPKPEIVEPTPTSQGKINIADRPSGETVTKPSEAVSAIEGDGKVRGLAKNTETEAIEAGLIQTRGELGELPTYAVRDPKVAQEIVSKLLDEDYNRALDIIDLKEPPPKGVLPEDVFTGIRVRAEMRGDVDTLIKLVDSPIIKEGTVLGQRIQALDTQNANSPFKAMKDISKARKEELARTGEKVDPIKQNAEIERLKTLLDDANKRLEEQTVKDKPKQRYGSQNKIVTQAEYLRVKEELRAQLGSQFNAVIDPTIAAKMVKIGTYHLEAGARSFASWSKVVLEDVGEWAKPHLEDIWKQTQESIRPISNEAKNSQRYKTRLQNEVKKYSERFETFDFRKEERNKANLTEEGRRIKEERDRIKTAYDAAVRKTGGISREEATILFDLAKRAAELKNLRDPNVKGNFGFKSAKERWEYGKAQAAFDKYVAKLKIGDESISTLAKNRLSEFKTEVKDNQAKAVGKLGIDAVGEVSATSISMVASLDVSFTLRQGGKMLMTHPTIWAKSVSKQVGDVYRALRYKHGNEVAKDILHADLVSRENYMDGHYQTAGILAKFEEQYPTSHPGRIPGIGRPFKASEIAFTNTALRMRIGYFDLLLDMAKKNGAEINTKLIKDLGAVVNGLTARSHIGGSKFVNVVLWAPRMMMANVNVLTAHGLGAGLSTKFARIEAAKNLIKITAETAAVAAVLNAIVPGSIELDPRSSDFLKYKDGNTRIDMTAGSGQYITLVARFLTGQTKNTQTKIIKDLGKSGFGDRTYFDVGMDFLINKTTPLVRQGIYFAKGRNFEGRKPTAGTALVDLTTPIPIKNIADDSFGDYSDDRAIVLLSNLADVFGLNANTYMPLDQWENKESKELVAFRKRVGEQRFEEANIRYNKIVNSRISQTTKTPYYQALSDEEKEKVITRIKRQTKQQILSGY